MRAELNCNTVSLDNSLIDLHTDARLCVCVCDSGDVTGAGEQQPGRSHGQRPGGRSNRIGVFAPSGRDLRRLRQSPDARQ